MQPFQVTVTGDGADEFGFDGVAFGRTPSGPRTVKTEAATEPTEPTRAPQGDIDWQDMVFAASRYSRG